MPRVTSLSPLARALGARAFEISFDATDEAASAGFDAAIRSLMR